MKFFHVPVQSFNIEITNKCTLACNTLYKSMVFLMSATAAGIVVGTRVPVILTSRADPPEARLASAALAAIVSQYQG